MNDKIGVQIDKIKKAKKKKSKKENDHGKIQNLEID
jgi:hypothetical protein